MKIPETTSVRVSLEPPKRTPLPGILVWFRLFLQRQPYFDGLVGLTDSGGVASVSASELVAQFAESQRLFPMDYKVSLDECDDEIEVGIDGNRDFAKARVAALKSGLVGTNATHAWSAAQNELVESATARRPLMRVRSTASFIDLATRLK
jgi:hypothetical protein